MPQAVRARVVADLEDGLKLTRFVAHRDVADDEITGTQELTFLIDLQAQPPVFGIGAAGIPPRPYDPQRIDRTLMLGGAEEWTLRSGFAGHPFHMHVNPFQIVRILDPQGRDVSAPDAVDDAGGAPDPQYPGLKGVWKDTLWVKSLTPPAPAGSGTYTVVVRSRTERYLGDAVLHCHILDHEDQGMMENIRFALPDGSGGVTSGHH
jgi:FtsP/CotA-like multicopper oxidase with cupredoxin domain